MRTARRLLSDGAMPPSARFRLLVVAALLALPRSGFAEVHWTPISDALPGGDVTALALDAAGELAVGGLRGAYGIDANGLPQTRLRRSSVSDLVHLDDAWLVATAEGLFRVRRDRVVREAPVPGRTELEIARLAAARGVAVAATGAGILLREGGARWRPLRELPAGPATLVALRPRARDVELWCVVAGELWIASIEPGEVARIGFAQRVALPSADRVEPALDVAFDVDGFDAVLVFPTSLSVRGPEGRWRTVRPALPPGARITRFAWALGRSWLATDAGLLSSDRLDGLWQRAAVPLGTTPVAAIAAAADVLWVANRRGISRGAAATALVGVAPGSDADPPRFVDRRLEPSVYEVQRAALRYVDLDPRRARAMRRGAERRGWLPDLHFTVGYDRRDARGRDDDQTFSSGERRDLTDTNRDRTDDFDLALTLSWDLGDVAFHPEEIDVLRETRAVIALRDDVLDEVTQLYFERRRVQGELDRHARPSVERDSLALRADELAAGLDAWTGGWFTRRLAAQASASGPALPTPHEHGKDR